MVEDTQVIDIQPIVALHCIFFLDSLTDGKWDMKNANSFDGDWLIKTSFLIK